MSITYSLTQKDIKAMTRVAMKRIKALHKQEPVVHPVIMWFFVVAVMVGVLRVLPGWAANSHTLMAGLALGIIMFFAWAAMLMFNLRAMRPDDGGFMLGERTVSLDPGGFDAVAADYQSRVKWSGVTAVEITEDYLFLFVDRISAHIVPFRVFASQADRDAFLDFVRAHAGR